MKEPISSLHTQPSRLFNIAIDKHLLILAPMAFTLPDGTLKKPRYVAGRPGRDATQGPALKIMMDCVRIELFSHRL